MRKPDKRLSLNFFTFLILVSVASLMVGCGQSSAPGIEPVAIEETEGGSALIQREFGTCDEDVIPENPLDYARFIKSSSFSGYTRQTELDRQLQFSNDDRLYPLRGSWRTSKAEIMDIVNKRLWSPSDNEPKQLLKWFDMVLLLNVAQRDRFSPTDSSAQRMQIYTRRNSINDLSQWDRIHVWPISSGKACGKRIDTPTGVYKFRYHPDKRKSGIHSNYYSNQFENIQMYETMFLYHDYASGRLSGQPAEEDEGKTTGVAIHGTENIEKLGRKDSGGCVRVERQKMTCLFNTIVGTAESQCLDGGQINYYGKVPSFISRNGEAEPEYLSRGGLEVDGIKVLIAIFDDENDKL